MENNEEIIVPVLYTPPVFYVYYDNKTGQILSVTNEKSDRYEYGFEIPADDAEHLLNGTWHFIDYVVGYKRINDATILGIVPRDKSEYSFRNNGFEWIMQTDDECDLTVVWDSKNKQWQFKLREGLDEYYKNLLVPTLFFFVTLEDDFDFLIRTIQINTGNLLENEITVPWVSDIESKFDKISISSKLVFNSYGLKVTNE